MAEANAPAPYYDDGCVRIYLGDCREILPTLGVCAAAVVTSPPYWRQRDYGSAQECGQEDTPAAYVAAMTEVFAVVDRALADDGSLWLNIGDKYAAGGLGGGGSLGDRKAWTSIAGRHGYRNPPSGYKPKDLTLVAFELASALRNDGWYLRQTIVWAKPAAVEPTRPDRPSTAHEYVFLLTKSEQSAVAGPDEPWWFNSVWTIRTDSDGRHPAAMPSLLARRCIVAGSKPGDLILDPFAGSGTSLRAAKDLGRRAVGIELNEAYCELAVERLGQEVLDFGAAA
jgi:site-specific DNA-methyltransferase (cytosine-N4-specific)